ITNAEQLEMYAGNGGPVGSQAAGKGFRGGSILDVTIENAFVPGGAPLNTPSYHLIGRAGQAGKSGGAGGSVVDVVEKASFGPVVIADIGPGKEQLIAMLKMLKQEHPQILTIVTIKMADSELVIDLINHAQIFRILNKPINVGILKSHLHDALQRYLTFKQTPELLHEHKVASSGQGREDAAGQGILDRIKSLRGKWFGA
ncbi:MAG: hypothetical protein ABI479_02995, partial [Gallionella sp.]